MEGMGVGVGFEEGVGVGLGEAAGGVEVAGKFKPNDW